MRSGTSKKDNLDPALIKDETVQRWLKNIPQTKKQKTEAPCGAGFCFECGMF